MFRMHTGLIRPIHFFIICFLLTSALGIPQPASAAVDHYASPSGAADDACTYADPCDLQTAVDQANGDNVYVAAGSYFSTTAEVLYIDHSMSIFGGWDGVTPSPTPDPVEYVSILDGTILLVNHRVVNVVLDPTESVTLSGFTIRDGDATSQTADCFYENSAGCGGGILVSGGSITIDNNIIIGNTAARATDVTHTTGYGGGISLQNVVSGTITNNTIASNDALDAVTGAAGSTGIGGGIYITDYVETGEFTITGNEIYGNNAVTTAFSGLGDGLYILYGIGEISRNYFHDNNPNLYAQGSTLFATHSDLIISENQFIDNHGSTGVYLIDYDDVMTSNVIINPDMSSGLRLEINTDPYYSYVANNIIAQHDTSNVNINGSVANPVLTRFYHNTVAGAPFGIYVYENATVDILNSILSHNGYGIYEGGVTGNTITVGYTLFHGNATNCDGSCSTSHLFTGDPLYVNATQGDYHIQANSAARDVTQDAGLEVDFEGDPRPMGDSHQYDVGADEFWWKIALPILVKP